jgi:hypothetical protein
MGVSGQCYAPAALNLWERTPGTHWTGGWEGLRRCLDKLLKLTQSVYYFQNLCEEGVSWPLGPMRKIFLFREKKRVGQSCVTVWSIITCECSKHICPVNVIRCVPLHNRVGFPSLPCRATGVKQIQYICLGLGSETLKTQARRERN